MANFTILGSGGFGMSLAVMLNRLGHTVTVWSAFSKELEDIKKAVSYTHLTLPTIA